MRRVQGEFDRYPSVDRRRRSSRNVQNEKRGHEHENEYWTVAGNAKEKETAASSECKVVKNILYQRLAAEHGENEENKSTNSPPSLADRGSSTRVNRNRVYDVVQLISSGDKSNNSDMYDSDDYDHLSDCPIPAKTNLKTNMRSNMSSSLLEVQEDNIEDEEAVVKSPHNYERIPYQENNIEDQLTDDQCDVENKEGHENNELEVTKSVNLLTSN